MITLWWADGKIGDTVYLASIFHALKIRFHIVQAINKHKFLGYATCATWMYAGCIPPANIRVSPRDLKARCGKHQSLLSKFTKSKRREAYAGVYTFRSTVLLKLAGKIPLYMVSANWCFQFNTLIKNKKCRRRECTQQPTPVQQQTFLSQKY